MLGFFAAIACRRAPSRALSAETFPSSESFPSCYCSFAIARKTIATAYCPLHSFPASFSSRFSSLGLHTMHQVAIAAHAEPSLRGVQNFASVGYHWQKKHTFTTACPAFVRKPLHSCSSSIEAVFPFPRSQAVSIHACALREDRFPSDNGLPSVPEEPKQLFPSSNCEAETERVTEMAMVTVTEKTEEARVEEKTSHMEAELFLPHEDIEANACCAEGEEDMVASVSPLSLEEIDAESAGGRSPRKTSSDAIASRARNRSERRRKGGLFAQNIQNDAPDLLTVPGIGPRNFQKLVAKGIGKVAELKQLYRDNFLNDESKKMVEYLQSSVGIVHKNHAESITSYVKHHVDEELKVQSDLDKESCVRQKKKVTICVEGNISVGKTTFLQKVANEIIELRDLVEIVPEPVDKWKDVGPDHFNLLDAFYNEPERYAYTFQNYVFATRLMKEQETSKGMKPLRLMERSIFSDRLVFVRAVHEAKWMSELELRIYESWFDPFISALPGLVPDGFIYLRASPDTCLQRLHMRNRPEERSVTLEYLRGLHEKHEQCFFPSECSEGIYSVSSWLSGSHRVPPPPRIRDRVFYLEGDHLHSSIRKVPALILDCEASIDFNRDLEARAEYAQQVAEFYEYIRSNKDLNMNETDPSGTVNPLLLPRTGGLLRPDGGSPLLHGHSLDAFNFARHSSAFMR